MSKLTAIKQVTGNRWKTQPRDRLGRFATTNGLEKSIQKLKQPEKEKLASFKQAVEKNSRSA